MKVFRALKDENGYKSELERFLADTIPWIYLQKNTHKTAHLVDSRHFESPRVAEVHSNLWGVYRNSEFANEKNKGSGLQARVAWAKEFWEFFAAILWMKFRKFVYNARRFNTSPDFRAHNQGTVIIHSGDD